MSHSKACCELPVAKANYSPTGEYIEAAGLKTYKTGGNSKVGIMIVYDIFGFSPQTLQGADILATHDKERQYQVFIPDYLQGQYANHEWFPPDTPEKQQAMGAYFQGPADGQKTVPNVFKAVGELGPKYGIEKWIALGMCWGGKIICYTSGDGSPFSAVSSVHPAMVDPADAKGIKVPFCMLASKDEDAEAVKGFGEALTVPKHVETFGDQVHGWMAARGDMEDAHNKAEYERGYQTLLNFYHEQL